MEKLRIIFIGKPSTSQQRKLSALTTHPEIVVFQTLATKPILSGYYDLALVRTKALEKKLARKSIPVHHLSADLSPKTIIDSYLPFRAFVLGLHGHRFGYPYLILTQNRRAVAFMSIDLPKRINCHLLVIPKRRYELITQIPAATMKDMMELVQRLGKALDKEYDGYNLLLNNRKAAGQAVRHAHIHIIPRRKADGIKIETWPKHHPSLSRFLDANRLVCRLLAQKD